MTSKKEVEAAIVNFKKVLLYEAQLVFFRKKLLSGIRQDEIKAFAESELRKLNSLIINGIYKPNVATEKKSTNKQKVNKNCKKNFIENNKVNKPIKVRIKEVVPKIRVSEDRSLNDTDFKFSNHTLTSLSELISVKMSFFEDLIKSRGVSIEFVHDKKITEEVWLVIREAVLNKLHFKEVEKKKEKEVLSDRIPKKEPTSTPLRKYIGGNFGKLILVGKMN